jgi:hypothetical protein
MDSKHTLEAPHNDELKTVNQIGDHSGVSGIYFHAHNEWEGKGLITDEEREARRLNQDALTKRGLRKYFFLIGVLVPLPYIAIGLFSAALATYARPENITVLLLPIIIALGILIAVSYASIKRVFAIFYAHSLQGLPFYVTLLGLLLLSLQAHYAATLPLYSASIIGNTLLTSAVIMASSIVMSFLLVYIWSSMRVGGLLKLGLIGAIAATILLVTGVIALT